MRAVFLDRDGTINRPIWDKTKSEYRAPHSPQEVILIPGVAAALAQLSFAGFKLVVVSNQAAVGRGEMSLADLYAINSKIRGLIVEAGGPDISDFFFCPHPDKDGCECRKPKPGMLLQAAAALELDLSRSYMIGDDARDIRAGERAGVRWTFGIASDKYKTFPRKIMLYENLGEVAEEILWKENCR